MTKKAPRYNLSFVESNGVYGSTSTWGSSGAPGATLSWCKKEIDKYLTKFHKNDATDDFEIHLSKHPQLLSIHKKKGKK